MLPGYKVCLQNGYFILQNGMDIVLEGKMYRDMLCAHHNTACKMYNQSYTTFHSPGFVSHESWQHQ